MFYFTFEWYETIAENIVVRYRLLGAEGIYVKPVKLGVKAKIKSKGAFNFTLIDIDNTYSIT